MYYVNLEQIEKRLRFIPLLLEACRELPNVKEPLVRTLAEERVLHLAIETVTDVGSLLIDGFIMRDASSYEDIVEILSGENVMTKDTAETLAELVKLRRPLVQDFTDWERDAAHPMMARIPTVLSSFADSVRDFIERELKG